MSQDTSTAKDKRNPVAKQLLAEEPIARTSIAGRARHLVLSYAMVGVLVLIAIGARIVYPGFLDPQNINNMFSQVVPVGIVAIGMTFVMIGGGFDLSVSAVFAGATVSFASLSNHGPLWVAFVATVALGILCGVFNGLIITRLKVNPFIATLSTTSIFSGATYLYSNSLPIQATNPSFDFLGLGKLGPVWTSTCVLVLIAIIASIALSRTTYGRAIYALGGNEEAARLAGIRVNLIKISTYMITGGCAAIGGMVTASQIGVGQPSLDPSITLNAIAIVVIGGTSLLGGEGAIWRTILGLIIWAMINNVFTALAVSTGNQLVLTGFIVLIAVALDTFSRHARK